MVQEKKGRNYYPATIKTTTATFLVSKVKDIFPRLDKRKISKIVSTITPDRDFTNDTGMWYVQSFHKDKRCRGWLEYDPCTNWIPSEVKRDMSKTKMMQLRIPVDLHKWFKRYTQETETTMTKVVISYLQSLRTRTKKNFDIEQI